MNDTLHTYTLRLTLAVLAIAGGWAQAGAKEARNLFTVSATVSAVARIEAQRFPAEIALSPADIRRGYVDVPEPTSLTIRSNSAQGFALDVMTLLPLASSINVRGLGSEQALGADGGTLVQRGHWPRSVDLALTFRLVLAPSLRPGIYPWPLRIAVRPLDF